MVATDWYGVRSDAAPSARVLALSAVLDSLNEKDADAVASIARRLADPFGDL